MTNTSLKFCRSFYEVTDSCELTTKMTCGLKSLTHTDSEELFEYHKCKQVD